MTIGDGTMMIGDAEMRIGAVGMMTDVAMMMIGGEMTIRSDGGLMMTADATTATTATKTAATVAPMTDVTTTERAIGGGGMTKEEKSNGNVQMMTDVMTTDGMICGVKRMTIGEVTTGPSTITGPRSGAMKTGKRMDSHRMETGKRMDSHHMGPKRRGKHHWQLLQSFRQRYQICRRPGRRRHRRCHCRCCRHRHRRPRRPGHRRHQYKSSHRHLIAQHSQCRHSRRLCRHQAIRLYLGPLMLGLASFHQVQMQ
mmetsp:Transcript_75209/g.125420  ORF Transcript_75209/g.125420 Transcript_75209/m.125420 type:complete len:254 (+) Transcript_75209:204-965(+)